MKKHLLLILTLFGMVSMSSIARSQQTGPPAIPDDMELQCIVILKIEFLASGNIGDVTTSLKNTCNDQNLVRQTTEAAKKIKFEPKRVDGEPVTVVKQIEYTLSTPYEEDSASLSQNAWVMKSPEPKFPKNNFTAGTIKVTVTLLANGKVDVGEVETRLPKEYKDAAIAAAKKIKFTPAIRIKDGYKVSQTKIISYEVKPATK